MTESAYLPDILRYAGSASWWTDIKIISAISNMTWKTAARQAQIDSIKISKHRRACVGRAQALVCDRIYRDWSEDEGEGYESLRKRNKLLIEFVAGCDSMHSGIERWKDASKVELDAVRTVFFTILKLKDDLRTAELKYAALTKQTPKSKKYATEKVFENWVWHLAAAFYEAGGIVTMTAPGSGGNDNYTGKFYQFAFTFVQNEPNWPHGLTPSSFGAKLYRTLNNLRKPRSGNNGGTFKIIDKGRVLRLPT